MAANKKSLRQQRILSELDLEPSLRIIDLAERLAVSTETIRRDFDELTQQGLINRTYGGAVRRQSSEPGLNERHKLHIAEREQIARLAMPVLAGSRHIMIGSGATTVHVAKRLAVTMNDLTVITHSFGVATVLAINPTIQVIMAPGLYHAQEGSMHGAQTIRFLENYRVEWAILGASGLDGDGASDALIEASDVYAVMMERATRSMIVADHTKFNQAFPARYCEWENVDVLVSDQTPLGALGDTVRKAGCVITSG
ncbi:MULTISPECIES: DeoR/GlpR family DNA-binding transcription regulator [Thalassospira]|uniref:DeoR family transcriptional regulator n=2 Tax=Thalassospira TaxID=168934 RepID=A0A367W7U0_9PROT|nr:MULTISPECIES: DeoR/GlpR family DNA-binding transcription regulator [Thalassospira]MDG4720525.1 DeoR/GlpR family DNA-binding transcription regulator [Thalassospira sp. FZY0004]RCK37496.1 DeoR family transcriptional regulator [Thalassospira profundimaris]